MPDNKEKIIWEVSPSWTGQFGFFFLCALFFWIVVPVFMALARLLTLRTTRYTLTNERLIFRSGIFGREKGEIELYRIKESSLRQNPVDRFFGVGAIHIISSDRGTPELVLAGLPDADDLRESLRRAVEERREAKHVREIDPAMV